MRTNLKYTNITRAGRARPTIFAKLSLALVAMSAAFGLGARAIADIGFISEPVVSMSSDAPLAGTLDFSTDVPARVRFTVQGLGEAWSVESKSLRMDHSIPLLGFAPDSQYTINNFALIGEDDLPEMVGDSFSVSTDPLPAGFTNIDLRTSNPNRMEPGLTLFGYFRARVGEYTMAVDAQGTVRWYMPGAAVDVRRRPDGSLLSRFANNSFIATPYDGQIVEFDFLGNINRVWHPESVLNPAPGSIPVATTNFHHDVIPLPNGNFITLSEDIRSVDGFPSSETDPDALPITTDVRDTPIVEFAPDGTIVQQWNLLDMLDTNRIAYGTYRRAGPANWSHTNGVIYDAEDDSIIVSARLQDAFVKFSRSTGELQWILAPHENWGPEFQEFLLDPVGEPFQWPYHAHAPMLLPNGNLMLYDNGNFRASPTDPPVPDEENYSRAVEFSIDEETREITQVWEYGRDAEEIFFTSAMGDADWLSLTDNVLLTFTPNVVDGETQTSNVSRIIEVTRDGERVFDLALSVPSGEGRIYRSERIPTLYPPEYVVTLVPEPTGLALCVLGLLFLVSASRLSHGFGGSKPR